MKRIVKKLCLSAGGIALIAILLPALASATELQAEKKPNEPMPLNSQVSASTTSLKVQNTGWGTWTCASAAERFSIRENGGAVVILSGEAGGAEGCYRNGYPMTFERFTLGNFEIKKPGEGTISASFTARFSGIECAYEGSGTFTYETGTNVIKIQGLQLHGSELCSPEVGLPELYGTFSLSSYATGEKVLIAERPAKWTRQTTGVTYGLRQDVTCTSASVCVAVGGYPGAIGERWYGSGWATTGASSAYRLTSVSCRSGVFVCLATPSDGLEVQSWNGSKWSTITATLPSEASSPRLTGVSCGRDTYGLCVAVGRYSLPGGKTRTLAELYDGEKWTVLTTPSEEGGSNELRAVSCDSSVSCTAVGLKGGKPTALHWNYTEWTTLAAPKKSGLSDISCTSASSCMAVGPGVGAVERWNGSEWVGATIPLPKGALSYWALNGVSCVAGVTADECIATGTYETATGMAPLAERWDGSKWEALEAVDPGAGNETELLGVSCSSVSRCTAVGYTQSPLGALEPLIERYQ